MVRVPVRMVVVALLIAGAWLFAGSVRAEASPRQDVIEYSGTNAAAAKAAEGIGGPKLPRVNEPGFQPADVTDVVKENTALVIVGVGAVLLVATWRLVSR